MSSGQTDGGPETAMKPLGGAGLWSVSGSRRSAGSSGGTIDMISLEGAFTERAPTEMTDHTFSSYHQSP